MKLIPPSLQHAQSRLDEDKRRRRRARAIYGRRPSGVTTFASTTTYKKEPYGQLFFSPPCKSGPLVTTATSERKKGNELYSKMSGHYYLMCSPCGRELCWARRDRWRNGSQRKFGAELSHWRRTWPIWGQTMWPFDELSSLKYITKEAAKREQPVT